MTQAEPGFEAHIIVAPHGSDGDQSALCVEGERIPRTDMSGGETPEHPLEFGLRRTQREHAVPNAFAHPQFALRTELQTIGVRHFAGTLSRAAEAKREIPVGLEDTDLVRLSVGYQHPSPLIGRHIHDVGEQVGVVAVEPADLEVDGALEDGDLGQNAGILPVFSAGAGRQCQGQHRRNRGPDRNTPHVARLHV